MLLPSQLRAEDFQAYPAQARQLCVEHLVLLRQLPLAFLPLLLRELVAYDWKFPAEQDDLKAQLRYLAAKSADELKSTMAPFAVLRLSEKLQSSGWVSDPAQFSEILTAHLWATHQIEAFRTAAVDFINKFDAAKPKVMPAIPRVGIVLIGRDVPANTYPLFVKLRRQGVYFTDVESTGGRQAIFDFVEQRMAQHPIPFAHWYIDGSTNSISPDGLTCVSYDALAPVRDALLKKMKRVMGDGGPELLRTELAQMQPTDVGMNATESPALSRFQLSLLTEGSGTQLYSTTFVQWSAREALRRAQPLTLLARFAPRRREQSMSELITGVADRPEVDPQGSLIDGDMGAYYTWLNLQRLPGAETSSFLVWFEAGREAVAIGPAMPSDARQNHKTDIAGILRQIA